MTDKQHKADLDRVASQNSITDFARGVEERPRGGLFNNLVRSAVDATPFGQAMHGRTNFELHDLNQMLDLVEQTNPEDLESSGFALWDARDAIKAAAKELDGHIENVHWVGESGDAFRTWSRSLVASTQKLSDFAGGAGDQITAVAVGLANVRSAMPPRDQRPHATRPEQLPKAKQVESNEEYATAVRVEKDRQEAINQMNRLSSYYSVSHEALVALNSEAPTFKAMPDVGVPAPTSYAQVHGSGGAASDGSTAGVNHHATAGAAGHAGSRAAIDTPTPSIDTPTPSYDATGRTPPPDDPARTNIDSVGTLPPPVTAPGTGHTPPVTAAPGTGGGPTSAFDGGYGTPVPNGTSGRGGGAGGVRPPASAQGRAGASGLSNQGTGRSGGRGPMNQMGRPTATGQSAAKSTASGAKSSSMGRGVTGGTPRVGGEAMPRGAGGPTTGAGRSNGVVGGRPTTAGGASGKGGPRIPRGTVIGAEETANSRTAANGRPGQRGVFGAPEPTARPGSSATASRGGAGTSEAVTGRPSARNSVAGAERSGMTRGGVGLVRGPGGQAKSSDGQSTGGPKRPEYLVEDEETHLPTRPRRDVPPTIS
ncbi:MULTISPECIES: WXG100 family type VII secretion target [Streptomyces]|nr:MULTISPECIES: WXG100 family type VII secretion target [Streptomyces]MYS98141.1 hypothetical protein [Streptomyces sp. SID5469]OOV33438.1 hypothetical protein SM007_12085 [Streptomyces avermitilis]GDY86425.1 hypothetical protein SAVCW2_56240 [Streptomyces avermitilis]